MLVTDGEQRAALAVVRSVGRAGHRGYVCSARARSLAGASRYALDQATVPDPLTDADGFVRALQALVARWSINVLIPVAEPALLAVLAARQRFRGVTIPFPDADAFRAISDKELLLRTAAEVGIAVPRQVVLSAAADRELLVVRDLPFPLVLKPSRSVGEANGTKEKLSVRHAADWAQLQVQLNGLSPAAYPLLMQQRVVGPGVGIFLLIWRGEVRAVFSHRRIREKPPSGGVSVYRESIPADPALVQSSKALLDRFGWEGVAMIEFKVDQQSGTPYLMEINGRFWGSLQLAVDAGVNFPLLLVEAARGEPARGVPCYREGVRSRWWWGEVDHLLARLRHTPDELSLPPGQPGRVRSLIDFLMIARRSDRSEVLRWSDPSPFLRETVDWLRRR